MSKAFTRESDDLPDRPRPPRVQSPLPPGARNYLTPGGAERLREELDRLLQTERPAMAPSSDDPEARQKLQIMDQRIQQLQSSLDSAVVVTPPVGQEDKVRFGATVIVRNRGGEETQYRIVGVDETDIDRGWVSWLSPIAKALLNTTRGDRVRFKFPSGEEELEIVRITYDE